MDIERNAHDHSAARAATTVCVTCAVPTGLQIALHQIHDEKVDHNSNITLKQGDNPGIDRAWFGCWLDENHELSLVTGGQITWRDEKPTDRAQEEVRAPVFAQPQSQPDSIEEMRQPGDAPFVLPEPDRDRENPNVPAADDKTAH